MADGPPIDRRRFIGASAGVLALAGAGVARGQGMVDRPGEVLRLDRPGVTRDPHRVDPAAARQLLDDTLIAWTGAADPVSALARYVHPEDRVALKVNALAAPGHPFHPRLADRLVELVLAIGVPPGRVVVYDQYPTRMKRSGYVFVDEPGEVACVHHAMRGYVEREVPYVDGKRTLRWCNVLDRATCVLNLMVPKDHDLTGVTGALKNMAFGNLDYVREFHRGIHHAIPWLYGQPEIRDKTRLIICDATRTTWDRGPQDQPKHRSATDAMLVSEDPVAMDWAVLEMVNAERIRRRLGPIEKTKRPPTFLHLATRMGLGPGFGAQRWRRIDGEGRVEPWSAGHVQADFADTPPAFEDAERPYADGDAY